MANALFDPGREGILDGTISMSVAVIKVLLVRGYTFSAAHKFLSDVTGASGVLDVTQLASPALASKVFTNGIFQSTATTTFTAPTANASNHSLILLQSSAVTGGADVAASAARLVAWIDTGTGFPIVPGGGDVVITWDTGANKIFKL
jgi:hypothetical protein